METPTGNRLLDALPRKDRESLLASARQVRLEVRVVVMDERRPLECLYFPLSGVLSLVIPMDDGSVAEVTTVGSEGMLGAPFHASEDPPALRGVSQIGGEALQIPVGFFRGQLNGSSPLATLVHRYVRALFVQISQAVACGRLHTSEQRCSRWLLTSHDQTGVDEFPMTQEFLAEMLGVRRVTVTLVAGSLQRAGLIRYSRGIIRVIDRPGLERAACECYEVMRRHLAGVTA